MFHQAVRGCREFGPTSKWVVNSRNTERRSITIPKALRRNEDGMYGFSVERLVPAMCKGAAGASIAVMLSLGAPTHENLQAFAETDANVGPCVVSSCGASLARCLTDPTCVENLVCLQACEGSPDKAGCQVKCGDIYTDDVVQRFDTCAISEKKCVSQIPDDGSYPVPPDCSLVESFKTRDFQGRWFITAGLNPLFDTFDCQAHYFTEPREGNLYGSINWRVKKNNGFFYNRNAMMKFVQDENNTAHLTVSGGEFLHFSDEWYIIGSKFDGGPDDYMLVYYRGNNDAWTGYGGGTLYTRAATVPDSIVPLVRADLEKIGQDWDKWIITDNTCGPEPKVLEEEIIEAEESLSKFEKKAVTAVENEIELEVAEIEVDVEQEFGMLKSAVESEVNLLRAKQQEVLADVKALSGNKEARQALKDQKKAERQLRTMINKDSVPGIGMPSK